MKSLFSMVSTYFNHFIGRNIANKIVVIESDDWGSIRTPSSHVITQLNNYGIDLSKNPYTRLDGLETNDDIEILCNLLLKYKDSVGNHPQITANFVTANPDFKLIEQTGFESYFYQKFTDTYQEYENSNNAFNLLQNGILNNLIYPQFHGREHVNVEFWLDLLRKKDSNFLRAFEFKMSGLGMDAVPYLKKNIQATYDTNNFEFATQSLINGVELFQHTFGFKSKSFIPNNFVLDPLHFEALSNNGISILQGMKYQLLPKSDSEKRQKLFRFNGRINRFNQIYLVRNCSYEPSESNFDHNYTLKQIKQAFFFKQPAIISSHRLNFTSRISSANRDANIKDLSLLLKSIIKIWPDVIFLNSVQLGQLYKTGEL